MTYLGDHGTVSARIHRLSEQPAEPGLGSIVATGSVTQGEFGVFRRVMAPDLVYVPRRGIHAIKALGDSSAEVLTIYVPGVPARSSSTGFLRSPGPAEP
jgi:hypothetical protein